MTEQHSVHLDNNHSMSL